MSNTGRTHFKKGHVSWLKGTKGLIGANSGSFKKGNIPWNKYLDLKKCEQCKENFRPREVRVRFCSKDCYTKWQTGKIGGNQGKRFPQLQGENHHAWKGNSVGYSGLHHWVKRILGTPSLCEFCGKSNLQGKEINWANKSGSYKREVNDWLRLCSKCHKNYDNGKITSF